MTQAICPHCGFDLVADEPLTIGELQSDPRGDVRWHGRKMRLTLSERIVLHSVAKAHPNFVPRAVLADRVDTNDNVLSVLICRIRKKLGARGHIPPLETVRDVGMRWAA